MTKLSKYRNKTVYKVYDIIIKLSRAIFINEKTSAYLVIQ